MTEDEARTKLCCGPHGIGLHDVVFCGGSNCMAWRTGEERKLTGQFDQGQAGEGWRDGGLENYGSGPVRVWWRATGYCGLAGKP